MKKNYNVTKSLFGIGLVLLSLCSFSQGLEDVIVETYYISDAKDATDTDGGSLTTGSVTYRIFVDMLPDYKLQAVYGNENHELFFETKTEFFNNEDRGQETGEKIDKARLDENTVALDSWLTVGGASNSHKGVLKTDDTDGSIVGGTNNDGGSESVIGGLLVNNDPLAGIPLTTSDGLMPGTPCATTSVGMDLTMFGTTNAGTKFSVKDGAYSCLDGAQGPAPDNKVLIAQLTTAGRLQFELNIQLGTPTGGTERYVAKDPINNEIQSNKLIFSDFLVEKKDVKNIQNPSFRIYPNPAHHIVNLEISGTEFDENNGNCTITNITGKTVLFKELVIKSEKYKDQLDISNLPQGMYFVKFTDGNNTAFYEKLIIH